MTNPFPTSLDSITVYDDFQDNPGFRPLVGTGTYSHVGVRKETASGISLYPVAKSFTIAQQNITVNGQTRVVGHFEVVCPLSVDSDYTGSDPYVFTLSLTGVDPLLTKPASKTVLLTADMPEAVGGRVRLSDLADVTGTPGAIGGAGGGGGTGGATITDNGDGTLSSSTLTSTSGVITG